MSIYSFNCRKEKMGYIVVDNLKGFMQHRPPLVVFMICLGLFAVALVSLAYYVKLHDVSNPDASKVYLDNNICSLISIKLACNNLIWFSRQQYVSLISGLECIFGRIFKAWFLYHEHHWLWHNVHCRSQIANASFSEDSWRWKKGWGQPITQSRWRRTTEVSFIRAYFDM